MSANTGDNNRFEIEGRWYEAMIGSCDFDDDVGLCLMITDANSGEEVLDICQVDSTRKCFVEHHMPKMPLELLNTAMEIFEQRVRLK